MRQIKYIITNSKIYFLSEDIIELLKDFAATEETDVRNRMDELIVNLTIRSTELTTRFVCRGFIQGDKMSAYRTPAEVDSSDDYDNRFIDDRCAVCNHESIEHVSSTGKCYECPAERRCAAFISKSNGEQVQINVFKGRRK